MPASDVVQLDVAAKPDSRNPLIRRLASRNALSAAFCASLMTCVPSQAQTLQGRESIHWAYSAFFGTGRYTLGDIQDVYALGVKPSKEIRAPSPGEAEGPRVGIRLRLPIAVTVHELEQFTRLDNTTSVGTVSVVPGVEFEIPVNDRWSLKPIAYLGWGTDLDSESSALIYWAGLKSQLLFDAGGLDLAVVNSLTYVGYSGRSSSSGRVMPLMTGVELGHRLGNEAIRGDQVFLTWHLSQRRYLKELVFDIGESGPPALDIDDEWELGVAFHKQDRRLRLGRLSWNRVGLAYRFSSAGDLRALKLTFNSLFDR